MARITRDEWKQAARKRYLDLRDGLRDDVKNMDLDVEPDNPQLREMRLIVSIARLHGITVKE